MCLYHHHHFCLSPVTPDTNDFKAPLIDGSDVLFPNVHKNHIKTFLFQETTKEASHCTYSKIKEGRYITKKNPVFATTEKSEKLLYL